MTSRRAKEISGMLKPALPLALALVAGIAAASPAAAGVKEDYMAACMGASGDNSELCTCKTEQALKLADEEMLGYVIIAMSEPAKFTEMIGKGEVPEKVVDAWGPYVMKSNLACRAGE